MAKTSATFYGYNPPFIGGPQNILSRQEDDKLIKNDILQLLLTVPGERVMRPTFGVNLRNFVFESMSDNDINVLRSEISGAIAIYDPRVTVDDVDITKDTDSNSIKIKIVVRLKRDPKRLVTVEYVMAGRA